MSRKKPAAKPATKRINSAKPIWAYAYELLPPQAEDRLHPIKSVLDREHAEAKRDERTWVGSVVVERQITHILVVSDSPEQDLEVNRSLETKLQELEADFSVTAPMRVADDALPPSNGHGPAHPSP